MIQVEHLTKLYGPKTAIADVSFSLEKGEVLAFLGPNGAGKTTTMRILTASLPATSGSAKIAGYDCFDQPKEVKRLIGYLPEIPPLYTEMTVTEYLIFAEPDVAGREAVRIRIVVVLPAPLGPRKASTSPFSKEKLTSAMAVLEP